MKSPRADLTRVLHRLMAAAKTPPCPVEVEPKDLEVLLALVHRQSVMIKELRSALEGRGKTTRGHSRMVPTQQGACRLVPPSV